MDADLVERVWFGRDPLARAGRGALAPLAWLYGAAVGARNALYDRGLLAATELALPAVSVGNMTVGGTGKTPVAAELARRLIGRGARPAIVLRGYGADEPLVHQRLNPEAVVVVGADRVAGAEEARRRGADVAVLDDALQHRRARRLADVVLLSADRWPADPRRLLPAGQWREPLGALRRASLAVVTCKAASDAAVAAVVRACGEAAPGLPVAVALLRPGELRTLASTARRRALASLRGQRVLAVAAVGDPSSFVRQLAAAGAAVDARRFPDHHAFTSREVATLAADAARADAVVCTLKDAVKLDPRWPRAAPTLWYVSQAVELRQGEAEVDRLLDRLLAARPTPT
jgi:tetraacyldisaccharide 4'-kinase